MNRRELIKGGGSIAVIGFSIPTLSLLEGCSDQNTVAALLIVAGGAISSVETIEGNTQLAAKIQDDFTKASVAVKNFVPGTPAQDVTQALGILESDLYLLPVSNKTVAYIDLAISTVQAIVALYPQVGITAKAATRKPRAIIVTAHPPKTAKEFKSLWNKQLSAHPVAGLEMLR